MLYADDAGVVSRSPEQLGKMMEVIVVVCAAFGLTVSEAKTEIMCLRAKGMPESTATFSVEAAGQVYNQTNEFVYLGGNVNADLSIEVDRRIRNAWCNFRKYTLELYDRPSAPLELKIRMLRAEVLETMLYGCVTWSPRAATTTRCAEPTTGSWLAPSVGGSTTAPTTRFPIWTRLSRREVRASRRLYAKDGSCLRDLWRAWRIRDCQSAWCSEIWWGARAVWGVRKKSGWGVSWTTSDFRHQPRPVDDCSPGRGGMAQNGRTRGGIFHGKMDRCKKKQGWTTACSSMPKRDEKDQGEDSPKQAGSCWFARPCWLATSGANLCPLGVWFADAIWRFFQGFPR